MSTQRVVVTGGCGFIGSHLVERLITRGDDVTILDGEPPSTHQQIARDHARYVRGNIMDPDTLDVAIPPGTDVVYHLAAVVGVDQYLARPLDVIDINFTGTRNVLARAARSGAKAVVASTSEVFGKNPAVPWREDDDRVLGTTTADRWTYSSSKALTEHLTFAFARQHDLSGVIVRYFNAYGPRQRPAFVISRSVHRALNQLPIVRYDHGRQSRCFTYIDDAIEGTLRAADTPAAVGQAFNIGSMTETSVSEAVDLIAEITGAAVETIDTSERLGRSYEDLARRIPDNTKARTILGWQPRVGLRDGITKTVKWALDNSWWLSARDTGAAGHNVTSHREKDEE